MEGKFVEPVLLKYSCIRCYLGSCGIPMDPNFTDKVDELLVRVLQVPEQPHRKLQEANTAEKPVVITVPINHEIVLCRFLNRG